MKQYLTTHNVQPLVMHDYEEDDEFYDEEQDATDSCLDDGFASWQDYINYKYN